MSVHFSNTVFIGSQEGGFDFLQESPILVSILGLKAWVYKEGNRGDGFLVEVKKLTILVIVAFDFDTNGHDNSPQY